MARKAYRSETDWTHTAEGHTKWKETRKAAQARANELGADQGIERNDFFKTFRTFGLPARQHRYGHELTCEVVHPENLDRCQPGHGPVCR